MALYISNEGISSDVDGVKNAHNSLVLMGYAARESAGTGAGAAFNIVDGETASSGPHVVPVEFAGDDSDCRWFGPDGIEVFNGLSINMVSGTVDVTLFYDYG